MKPTSDSPLMRQIMKILSPKADTRARQLAELVIDYSVDIQKGDRLLIQFDPAFAQYANLLSKKAREKGGEVRYDSMSYDPRVLRGFISRTNESEWQEEVKRRIDLAQWCNARVVVDCNSGEQYLKGIPAGQEKWASFWKAMDEVHDVLFRPGPHRGYAVKWNLTGFPCEESAKKAGMSLEEYTDFVYAATIGNEWPKMAGKMQQIKRIFNEADDVHLVVPGLTDLHLSLKGREGDICDGKWNMPDGEVYYGPVEDSANGHIFFQVPTQKESFGIIKDIALTFENGVITSYSARENQKELERILTTDEGIKRIGEFGIGCNRQIQRAILETLFDEKIGGTIHLALGNSYKLPLSRGGGLNKSSIHWDIVCDLRRNPADLSQYPGGELYVDGRLVQKKGLWVFDSSQ